MKQSLAKTQLEELQRFAELGRVSASLLHEISNPLTAALLHLEISDSRPDAVIQARRDIEAAKRYVEAACQQIRLKSRVTSFDVKTQLTQLKRVILPLAKRANIKLELDPAPNCQLYGDPVKFQHLLANLIINAIEAYEGTDAGSEALVRVNISNNRHWLTIKVTDWGKGIQATELPKLFEPFYTTKTNTGRGLGIGLAIVKQYITVDYQGAVKVSSSGRRGTQFVVRLRTLPKQKLVILGLLVAGVAALLGTPGFDFGVVAA